jgi:hypothetical protein
MHYRDRLEGSSCRAAGFRGTTLIDPAVWSLVACLFLRESDGEGHSVAGADGLAGADTGVVEEGRGANGSGGFHLTVITLTRGG